MNPKIEKLVARLRKTRWLPAALIAGAVAIVGLAIWLARDLLFSHAPPPDFAQYSEPLADGVPLADFLSGMSIEDARAKLASHQHSADRSESHKPPSKRYPPRDLDSLEVIGYRHLGTRGHLTLEFFNDRLYEVRFEPDDPHDYRLRLHADEPGLKRDRVGMVELVRGVQRITSNVDLADTKVGRELNTHAYAIWQDLRLKQQLAQWEESYGVEAVRRDD
jgi:hypothetical protein